MSNTGPPGPMIAEKTELSKLAFKASNITNNEYNESPPAADVTSSRMGFSLFDATISSASTTDIIRKTIIFFILLPCRYYILIHRQETYEKTAGLKPAV